ncbi:MAG: NAD(+)/NADH kinase [Ruminococcaceae bacterium]|nr:NAD(+)/NADH kinase [Oscillospiraceae bacterium]
MKYCFEKIAVLPNAQKDAELIYTKKLLSHLEGKYLVLVQKEFDFLAKEGFVSVADDKEFYSCDLILVLGGDGTILRAAANAARASTPIMGINLGRLGYIAELETEDIPHISEILSGELETESRTMLEVSVVRDGQKVLDGELALNDAAVVRASGLGVVEVELFCNGNAVYKYRGDGLIASSATGSSAYSMSAGGPVMDTGLDCISITPICAHSLRCRPIVFSGDSTFEIKCKADPDHAKLSLDGEETCDLSDGDTVIVKKSKYRTKLVRAGEHSFCSILYRKMSDI